MILYAAADLVWASRIKGTCDSLGISARPVRSVEMLEARLADSDVRGLVVDLETGAVGLELIRRLRPPRDGRGLPIVAFGAHVEVELLESARASGADQVMPRGAFSGRMPQILAALAGVAPGGAGA